VRTGADPGALPSQVDPVDPVRAYAR